MNNKVLKRNKKIYNEVPENILVSILTLQYEKKLPLKRFEALAIDIISSLTVVRLLHSPVRSVIYFSTSLQPL